MNTFCSVNCVDIYRTNRSNATAAEQVQISTQTQATAGAMPVIQSVSSLAGAGDLPAQPDRLPTQPLSVAQLGSSPPAAAAAAAVQQQIAPQVQTIREMVKDTMVHTAEPAQVRNKATLTKPFMQTKGISCRPHTTTRSTQTDLPTTPTLVPICVPAFMPMPMQMYNAPYPVPIPVPVPVPVPVFVPTSRNSYRGVMKKIKKIMSKMPTDPFEAELLALAGGLVGKKDGEEQFSDDSEFMATDDEEDEANAGRGQGGAQQAQTPQEDFEREISGGRVVPKPLPLVTPSPAVSPAPGVMRQQHASGQQTPDMVGGQKRRYSQTREGDENGEWNWQQRRTSQSRSRSRSSRPKQQRIEPHQNAAPAVPQPPKERPDKNHHLKFTYGVNAWKHWVVQKNAELEKLRAQGKYMKTFETDILKLRADELNFTLCMFVKEVKKPNGEPYAPDSIFYLTLGIQEYLFDAQGQ